MSNENISEFETSSNLGHETAKDDNKREQQIPNIEETNEQGILSASVMENLQNQLLPESPAAKPVLFVGKTKSSFIFGY